jgi:hypothetical protein
MIDADLHLLLVCLLFQHQVAGMSTATPSSPLPSATSWSSWYMIRNENEKERVTFVLSIWLLPIILLTILFHIPPYIGIAIAILPLLYVTVKDPRTITSYANWLTCTRLLILYTAVIFVSKPSSYLTFGSYHSHQQTVSFTRPIISLSLSQLIRYSADMIDMHGVRRYDSVYGDGLW